MGHWRYNVYIALLGVIIVGGATILYLKDRDYSLATFKFPDGYVLDIRTPYFWEMTQPVTCQLIKAQHLIFHKRVGIAGVKTRKLKFKLVEHENGVVAIIEQANPYDVVAIFDFKQGVWFPSSDPKITFEDEWRIGEELVQRLNKDRLGRPFDLRGTGVLGITTQEK